MPRLGFGVYQSKDAANSVTVALQVGYRHVDSARMYRNEGQVADVIARSSIPRDEIFFTTKVYSAEHGSKETGKAVDDSLKTVSRCTDYFDLILLHDPKAGRKKRIEAYRALLKAKDEGKTKDVGVSNYGVKHLQEIEQEGLPMPAVNQIELHPWCQQKPIVDYCKENNVVVQAYCPLVRAERNDDPTLLSIAKAIDRTPAQVLVRWSLQKGFVPLPKSDTPSRIKENAQVFDFELSREHMDTLDSLDQGKAGACSWNPIDAA